MRMTKKILWVKGGGFLPLDTGGKIRSYNLISHLARSHSIVVFTFYGAHEQDENTLMNEIVERAVCHPLDLPKSRSFKEAFRYFRNFFSTRPFAVEKYCRRIVQQQVRELISRERFDLVVCDFLVAAGVIPWEAPIPKLLFTHNVEAAIWKRLCNVTHNPIKRVAFEREWRTTKAFEAQVLHMADHVLTVSNTDRDSFSSTIAPERITIVPTGVNTDFFRSTGCAQRPRSLVFTGSMDWIPNEDGIVYFLRHILPLVRRSLPDTSLTIVGRSPSANLKREVARIQNVLLTGRVDDVRPYVDQAEVYIVPLRAGSGTRLKIFEAMALRKAIVSTTVGAEGLAVINNRHLLLADDSDEFASAVLRLLENAGLRNRIGSAARELVENKFSWTAAANTVDRVISRLTSEQGDCYQPTPVVAASS
jgi:sugar transferase (PEP-CTERM/EpsH1 system associated)